MAGKEVSHVFAINLRRFMESNNMTGKELAARLGVAESSVSNWLHEINVPRTGVLQKLTQIFDCSPADLLTAQEDIFKKPFDFNLHGENKKSPASEEAELSEVKKKIIARLNQMSDEQVKHVSELLDVLDPLFKDEQ